MPPVLGPRSPSKARLWSWAVPISSAVVPSHKREQARLLAVQELLDHQRPVAGIDRRQRLLDRGRDHDPLAGGEPVRLDHDRRPLRRHIRARRGPLARPEAAPGGGGDAVPVAERLGERLRALQPRRRRRRPERLDAGRPQPVDQPQHQRHLRPDHDQPHTLALRQCHEPAHIVGLDRHAARHVGDPGIARRAHHLVHQRRGGQRPAQRVLAPAAAHDQHLHPALPAIPRRPLSPGRSARHAGEGAGSTAWRWGASASPA